MKKQLLFTFFVLLFGSIFMSFAQATCGGLFTDDAGTNTNYSNSSNVTTTICATNPSDIVTVTFTSFALENNFDFLKVYDGSSATAPLIANLTGTNIPQPISASVPGGCLTFVFTSDASVTNSGWIANVDCMPQGLCTTPISTVVTNVSSNSAVIGWTETGSASQWEVLVVPCGTAAPTAIANGVITSSSPTTISGLNSSTCYNAYVRAICSPTESSIWSGPITFTTSYSPPVCGGTFTDPQGANANYANSTDYTVTICPSSPGENVTVTFTAFSTETNWDALYVFDGNSITSPQIPSIYAAGNVPGGLSGGFWGTTIPGPFTSSSQDGCLTFRFRSDGSVNAPGWIADVTCGLPPTCLRPTNLVATNITATSATVNWTEAGTATSWEVFAVPCGSPAPTESSTGTITSSFPYTFTGLNPNTCYIFYVRSICSSSDISVCSFTPTATTLSLPPSCGGNYTDNGSLTGNYSNNSDETITICPTTPGEVVTVTFTSFNTETLWDALYVFDGNSINSQQIPSTNGSSNVPGGLAGGYWGTTIPGPFTSTDSSGCLTFRFRSDNSVNLAGWNANVTCAPDQDKVILLAFVDSNGNGLKDANESNFPYGNFKYDLNNSGSSTNAFSPIGRYIVYDANPTNSYDFSYEVQTEYLPYYSSGTTTYNDISIPIGSGTQTLYFPITLIQAYNDVTISVIPLGAPRPGMTYMNRIQYTNLGIAATDGTITFVKPAPVTVTNVSQTGTVNNVNGFTYAFTNLLAGETRIFYVTMSVPTSPTVNLNDLLTASATITAPANDVNLVNNTSTNSQIVVNSFDPNDKMESHGDKIPFNQFSQNDYLYYTIRFQNNGTANAIDVRIEDILNPKFDETSIRMISSSHNYLMTRVGNNLSWDFRNIQLVPSATSATLSSGYVYFKIKLKPGFVVGDIIPNNAAIFFDTNPAIVTNTFNIKFTSPLSNNDFDSNSFTLYPNPANDLITIDLNTPSDSINKVVIYDVIGKSVKEINSIISTYNLNIDVSDLQNGIYLIEITTSNGLKQNKKLIIK
jgi:hypothetical protein